MTAKGAKPFWEMNAEELAVATKEFDVEFVADKARSLTPAMRARWAKAKAKRPSVGNGAAEQIIAVHVETQLLERCARLAKKKRMSRDFLISWGLRAVLAAEESA